MSKALEGMHYCKEHQGNQSHYATENCEVCRLRAEVASLKEERDALRRKIFTNTNGEFTLENRTFSIEGFDFILDNNFDFDAGLNVSGDFGGDEKRHDYMQMICNALNSHYALTQQLAAANGRGSSWWAALMEAAGCLEQAAMSMRDEDAKRAALGAAEHARNDAHRLAALSDLPEADKEKS